jgi:oxaloacetate decarboxylase gamma subunit
MMTSPLLQQGLDLMVYGMGTVFLFLTLLVAVTALMSSLVSRFLPDKPEPLAVSTSPPAVDERTLAIIQQAIDQHRKRH